ncbi:MAG: AAA family ATPase [Acidimicrobiia bacterium]|nr:AAA family ATPase [Acidimicrobiia bacterium]
MDVVVGREAELEQLATGLRDAAEGRPGVVLVTGEPGIGKTALLRAFSAELAAHVFKARADEAEQDVPFAALGQLLGAQLWPGGRPGPEQRTWPSARSSTAPGAGTRPRSTDSSLPRRSPPLRGFSSGRVWHTQRWRSCPAGAATGRRPNER